MHFNTSLLILKLGSKHFSTRLKFRGGYDRASLGACTVRGIVLIRYNTRLYT